MNFSIIEYTPKKEKVSFKGFSVKVPLQKMNTTKQTTKALQKCDT